LNKLCIHVLWAAFSAPHAGAQKAAPQPAAYCVTLQFSRLRRFRVLKALRRSKLCVHVCDFAGGSLSAQALKMPPVNEPPIAAHGKRFILQFTPQAI